MTLHLDRSLCSNLATASQREWLITNGTGGYGCGTVAGVLTRRYHGLLVAALAPPMGRTLLVTQLQERVTYHDQIYELASNHWLDGSVAPQGYRYLERFHRQGTIPTWTYALGDGLLIKQIWMEPGANTTYLRYHLQRGQGSMHLTARALVNYRPHHHTTQAGDWRMEIQPLGGAATPGVGLLAFEGATPVYLAADAGQCTAAHDWYRGYHLTVEQQRGLDYRDDHLHCATFEVELAVGAAVTIRASTTTPPPLPWSGALARRQAADRQCLQDWRSAVGSLGDQAPDWLPSLVLAADQFVVSRPLPEEPRGCTIMAGYPWFGDWGRDTMIALAGLTLTTGRPHLAATILRTFARYLDQGMLPNLFPEAGQAPAYNTVDAVLWYFEAVRAYYAASGDLGLVRELFPALVEVVGWHQRGTRYHIHLDGDGLIYAGEMGLQLTWMDAKVGDWVITPRIGKPIEISALWYNALVTLAWLGEELGYSGVPYRRLAAQTRQGMQRFWCDPLGHCYDLLDGPEGDDPRLRPNQILAVALPPLTQGLGPPLFEPGQQKQMVDRVSATLLTSYGLRSLSPHHPDYAGDYGGDPRQRDSQYHQGTVWGWLIGPFVQAHLQVYQDPTLAAEFLEPLADHLVSGCVGSLGEIFAGDPPHRPCGAFAQAWTVAEVLRAWHLCQGDWPLDAWRQGIPSQ